MSTPKGITFIVVGALAVMSLTYMGTLAFCALMGIKPEADLMRSFEAAGIFVLGNLSGILINTRSQPPADNGKDKTTPPSDSAV